MKQKSRIVWKLFYWNVLIFSVLLLIQLAFQSELFEPFLVVTQQRRLTAYMNSMKESILQDDMGKIQQLVDDADGRGIVLAAVGQDRNLLAGQSIDQYQRCFTLIDEKDNQYTIIEDYVESVPLQNIEVGDEVSIEGYLIDQNNKLVIPSKVYRTTDGVVLGTDTFLVVNNQNRSFSFESDENETEDDVMFSTDAQSGQRASDRTGTGTVQQPTSTTTTDETQEKNSEEPVTNSSNDGAVILEDENNLPKGFLLESPFDALENSAGFQWEGAATYYSGENASVLNTRMLIVSGDGRETGAYPITIAGSIVDKEDQTNNDISISRGLVAEEIDRLGTEKAYSNETSNSYTVTKQLTTGKYLLDITFVADRQVTLLGAISLYSVQDINGMMNRFHILIYTLVLILFAGSIYLFSRKIARPLIEMNGVALKIAQQDFSSAVQISTNDEFATLGNSINEISMNLEQKINQINAINERLQQDYEHQLELYQRHKKLSATYSHEIKTPLTILRGYIDGMQNGIYPFDQEGAYQIALRELDSASSIITQMLEITKMESSYFALNKSVVDLWMIFYREYDALKQTMDQKGMNVEFHATAEAYTMADVLTLGTVISNALTNAMKYSPRGSRISVRIKTESGQHIFSIENENAFISEKELEKIWQPFYRAEKTKTIHESGSGLGLVIVREILEAHDFPHGIQNTERGVMFYFVCSAIQTPIE